MSSSSYNSIQNMTSIDCGGRQQPGSIGAREPSQDSSSKMKVRLRLSSNGKSNLKGDKI